MAVWTPGLAEEVKAAMQAEPPEGGVAMSRTRLATPTVAFLTAKEPAPSATRKQACHRGGVRECQQ